MGIEIPLQGELALMKGLALKAVDRFENVKAFQAALMGQGSAEFAWEEPKPAAPGVIEPRRPNDAKLGGNRPSEWLNANGFYNVQPSDYWSSTTYAGLTGYAWYVNFHGGYVYSDVKSNTYYVRCVRGGQ